MNIDRVRVGDVRNTNEGGSYTVIEVNSAIDILIAHNDEHKHIAKVAASYIRKGQEI